MSLDAVSWAMEQTVGRSAAKLLLVTLADCVNGKGTDNMICFPSFAFLAQRTELDKKSVTKNMQWLVDRGFIEKTGGRHGRTGQVHEYRLKEPESGVVQDAKASPKGHHISPESNPETGTLPEQQSTPLFPAKDTKFPPKGHHISPESNPNVVHGTSKEQVKEQVKKPKRARGKSSDLPNGFAEFWQQYPNKSAKLKAAKLWVTKRLHENAELRTQVMAALAVHCGREQWTKDGGRFVPLPSTWLFNERWTDEVRPAAVVGGSGVSDLPDWCVQAGFEHIAEAENARCHIGNYREFRNGKRITDEVHA